MVGLGRVKKNRRLSDNSYVDFLNSRLSANDKKAVSVRDLANLSHVEEYKGEIHFYRP